MKSWIPAWLARFSRVRRRPCRAKLPPCLYTTVGTMISFHRRDGRPVLLVLTRELDEKTRVPVWNVN